MCPDRRFRARFIYGQAFCNTLWEKNLRSQQGKKHLQPPDKSQISWTEGEKGRCDHKEKFKNREGLCLKFKRPIDLSVTEYGLPVRDGKAHSWK